MGKPRRSESEASELRSGLLFTAPAIIGLAAFTVYPAAASFWYSFCNYSGIGPPKWIGLANYAQLLRDPLIIKSLANTGVFALGSISLGILAAFLLALLLNQKVKGLALFRTLFYLPSIVPAVANSVLWIWMLNPEYGILNSILRVFHIPGPGWLGDPVWSKPALILMSTWGVGNTMVIFLAGLQDVPRELYEAAEIDGASAWGRMANITLPFMSPYLFFSMVMGFIGASQYFTQVYVMTVGRGLPVGAPVHSTLFFALYLFQNAFVLFKMGYACAMAWLLFVVTLGGTLFLFRTSAKHVYYHGEVG